VELLAERDEKRVHRKSHGLVPFSDMFWIIARNHKDIDNETREFVNEVAARLPSNCDLLEAAEETKTKAELKEGLERKEEYMLKVREGGAIAGGSKSPADMFTATVRFQSAHSSTSIEYVALSFISRIKIRSNALGRPVARTARTFTIKFIPRTSNHLPPFSAMTLPHPPLPLPYDTKLERLLNELPT
jgi:hypothetical protein